jgi:hypothetical protein
VRDHLLLVLLHLVGPEDGLGEARALVVEEDVDAHDALEHLLHRRVVPAADAVVLETQLAGDAAQAVPQVRLDVDERGAGLVGVVAEARVRALAVRVEDARHEEVDGLLENGWGANVTRLKNRVDG